MPKSSQKGKRVQLLFHFIIKKSFDDLIIGLENLHLGLLKFLTGSYLKKLKQNY